MNFVVMKEGLASATLFLSLSWWLDPPASHVNWLLAPVAAWAVLAFLGWIATDLGYGLRKRLLSASRQSQVAPFSLGAPFIGRAAGIQILGERVSPLQWIGALLVLCALGCVFAGPYLVRLVLRKTA
jgi:O-acetylserine/cysteine efflux transporter